ncbi:response regulator [Leptospira interrogans]|uniref:Two-component response regulator receiver protein n=13 Tax=Leptospira interrogans TaxID=173 RepID=Q8F4U1_LEPIN|nr:MULTISPECIES: response regulator [Leptospira]EMF43701.1 response regulator receiver domain protein [Leptospira interrogans serovar Lora str. TE 1992]EMG09883.1 response regulator receiver domain protein [Leptospira interrogans serovar Grippotyphosa str. LT2186]EMM95139.1 response regulator receiver domain protein [Leptospira interrogans serovar Zanoni str. LT2156]EMN73876.1 response regulator receiver domain protein [Leptospira interrogans serovar Bataviae str. UI 08561]EMP09747.1 response 
MNKGYIICVDDEISVLETIQQQLRNEFGESHEIEIANSAEEALALMEEIQNSGHVIEVIITDQVMPGMKGSQFLEEVHKKLPDSIKIMLTGQAGLDSAIHAINYGGLSRYVEKPWNIEELTGDIRFLIEKFRQNLENQHLINELSRKIQELEEQNQKSQQEI